jgi:hypothetical protein
LHAAGEEVASDGGADDGFVEDIAIMDSSHCTKKVEKVEIRLEECEEGGRSRARGEQKGQSKWNCSSFNLSFIYI